MLQNLPILTTMDSLTYISSGKKVINYTVMQEKVILRMLRANPQPVITTGGQKAVFFDADHDGDLDLFELRSGTNKLFRNNADGTFLEQAGKMGIAGSNLKSSDAAFGDFDEDGDIDLVVVNENGNNTFFFNQRQGIYKDVTQTSGLQPSNGSGSVDAGDYNNDGFLDLLITSVTGEGHQLYRNMQNGTFRKDENAIRSLQQAAGVKIFDSRFVDVDNDGFQDIILAGEPATGEERGIFLFHNDGKAGFCCNGRYSAR